ncbi:MAG TPA: mechanosensitive ion channel family protein [Thermoleophilaceae bacterium]|nr:mechanosensitive ion channel family protein [Thermoleophilaceae bacterium]
MPLVPDTKTHYWREAGLSAQIDANEVRRARRELIVVVPLIAAVLILFSQRRELFGNDIAVRAVTVLILAVLGWLLARAVGRVLRPTLFRRLDPGTAGTVGFLIRLATIGLAVLVALRVAGLRPETLAVGGAVTAVVIGLAAQQTIGNVFAGMVLLSARPLQVGQRVRMSGAGHQIEGVVSALGLLYTTLQSGEETIMVPNNVVIMLTIVPLREAAAVDLRARLPVETRPSEVQRILQEAVSVKTCRPPSIELEEVDDDEVVVRISATPVVSAEGAKLADEVIAAMARVHRDGGTA